jgi:hypothetical protein
MQLIEDLESLTHELPGLYSTAGERPRTDASFLLRLSSTSNQTPRILPGVRYEQDTRGLARRGDERTPLIDTRQSSGVTTEALPAQRSSSYIEGGSSEVDQCQSHWLHLASKEA